MWERADVDFIQTQDLPWTFVPPGGQWHELAAIAYADRPHPTLVWRTIVTIWCPVTGISTAPDWRLLDGPGMFIPSVSE